jgi:adenosylcobinamide kinase / adenosylcobinamide-phosphate guanylyltransferase
MSGAGARVLVLGGVRSGKSRRASAWATHWGGPVTVIATAEPIDAEMRERIAAHRRQRPASWRTLESPRGLAQAVDQVGNSEDAIVVDCLTVWLTNLLVDDDDAALEREVNGLISLVSGAERKLVLVANECSLGLIGATPLARRFVDLAGSVQQRIAACCDRVEVMLAGLPIVLKGSALEAPP